MNEFTRSFYAIISILLIGFILIVTGNNSSAAEITEDEIIYIIAGGYGIIFNIGRKI